MSIRDIFPIDKWDFKSGSILAGLHPVDIDLLIRPNNEQLYKKGEIIFREGTYAAGIFVIVSGMVKKYKLDKERREQIIYVANAGELIGYHAILSEDRYPDSAATLEESRIAFVSKEDFANALQLSPVLSKRLLHALSHEFVVLVNSLVLFAQRPVRERLALQLILLREKYKKNFQPGMAVEINMSRDDLASLVGTARENLVRALAEFKDQHIVETKGRKIIVQDIKKLIEISNYL